MSSQPSSRSPWSSEKLRSRPDSAKQEREKLWRRTMQGEKPAKLLMLDRVRTTSGTRLDSAGLGRPQAPRFALRVKWPAKLQALDCLRLVLAMLGLPGNPKRLGSRQALRLPSQLVHSFQYSPSPDPTSFCQA